MALEGYPAAAPAERLPDAEPKVFEVAKAGTDQEQFDRAVAEQEQMRCAEHTLKIMNESVCSQVENAILPFQLMDKGDLFQNLRGLSPWVRSHLPGKGNVDEDLKDKVVAVEQECKQFGNFMIRFVKVIQNGAFKVQALSAEVHMLTAQGVDLIIRVQNGAGSWDPGALTDQIASVKLRYEAVQKFVEESAEKIRAELDDHLGEHMDDLIDEIDAAGCEGIMDKAMSDMAATASALLTQKKAVNKETAKLNYLTAEKARCEEELATHNTLLAATRQKLKDAEENIQLCDDMVTEKKDQAQEAVVNKCRQMKEKAEREKDMVVQQSQLQYLRNRSKDAISHAAKVAISNLDFKKSPEIPVHFVFMLDMSHEMRFGVTTNDMRLGERGQRRLDAMKSVVQWICERRRLREATPGPCTGKLTARGASGASVLSQQLPRMLKDKVSVLTFDGADAQLCMSKGSWDTLLNHQCMERSANATWVHDANFTKLFDKARTKALFDPPAGSQHRTQFILITTGSPSDAEDGAWARAKGWFSAEYRGYVAAANELYSAARQHGPASSLVLFCGQDPERDIRMKKLVMSLNGGALQFKGGDEHHDYDSNASDETYKEKFDILTDYDNTDFLREQMKFKYANDQRERMASLIQQEEADIERRQQDVLDRLQTDISRLQEDPLAFEKYAVERLNEKKESLETFCDGYRATIQKYLEGRDKLFKTKEELEAAVADTTASVKHLEQLYESASKTFTDTEYLEKQKQRLDQARERYTSIKPKELINVLTTAKMMLTNMQIVFDGMLASFEQVCVPVKQMIRQLELRKADMFDDTTAKWLVIDMYRNSGLKGMSAEAIGAEDNWRIIVSFHCAGGEEVVAKDSNGKPLTGVDVLTTYVSLDNLVTHCLEDNNISVGGDDGDNKGKKRTKKKTMTQEHIKNLLLKGLANFETGGGSPIGSAPARDDADDPDAKPVDFKQRIRDSKKGQRTTAKLAQRIKKLKDSIEELKEEIADLDDKGKDTTAKEQKLEEKENDLEKKEEEMNSLDDDANEMLEDMEEDIEARYPAVFGMLPFVIRGVSAVFGQVILQRGLADTKNALFSLHVLFKRSIGDYCKEAGDVAKVFLKAGEEGHARLADSYSKGEFDTLLPEFQHLARAGSALRAKRLSDG